MTARELLNLICYNDRWDAKPFILYDKNAGLYGSTLYENIKVLNDKNVWNRHTAGSPVYDFYEFLPFEWDNGWCGGRGEEKEQNLRVLKALKQYRLQAIYNIDENATIKEGKELLLIPLIDKILNNKSAIATLFFLNRIDSKQVSLEVFLFCLSYLEIEELDNIMFSPVRCVFNWALLSEELSTYWFYRLYCEIFLNRNVLTSSSAIFSFSLHHNNEDNLLSSPESTLKNLGVSLTREEIGGVEYIFEDELTNDLSDWLLHRVTWGNGPTELFLSVEVGGKTYEIDVSNVLASSRSVWDLLEVEKRRNESFSIYMEESSDFRWSILDEIKVKKLSKIIKGLEFALGSDVIVLIMSNRLKTTLLLVWTDKEFVTITPDDKESVLPTLAVDEQIINLSSSSGQRAYFMPFVIKCGSNKIDEYFSESTLFSATSIKLLETEKNCQKLADQLNELLKNASSKYKEEITKLSSSLLIVNK